MEDKIMKRLIVSLLVFCGAYMPIMSQNIKVVEMNGEEHIYDPYYPMPEDWQIVDSLVIKGNISDFNMCARVKQLAEFFNLTGLNLSECLLENNVISDFFFEPDGINSGLPGEPGSETIKRYWYENTEERCFRVNIKHITLPDNITKIGDMAFYRNNIEEFDLPRSVKKIGSGAFRECKYMKSFTVHVMSPNEIESPSGIFDDTRWDKTLYVPKGADIKAFKESPTWKDFMHIVETNEDVTGIETVKTVGHLSHAKMIYTLDGRTLGSNVKALKSGVYIVNGKKVVR